VTEALFRSTISTGVGDFGNPTRTEEVWDYGRILYIRELGRGNN